MNIVRGASGLSSPADYVEVERGAERRSLRVRELDGPHVRTQWSGGVGVMAVFDLRTRKGPGGWELTRPEQARMKALSDAAFAAKNPGRVEKAHRRATMKQTATPAALAAGKHAPGCLHLRRVCLESGRLACFDCKADL